MHKGLHTVNTLSISYDCMLKKSKEYYKCVCLYSCVCSAGVSVINQSAQIFKAQTPNTKRWSPSTLHGQKIGKRENQNHSRAVAANSGKKENV